MRRHLGEPAGFAIRPEDGYTIYPGPFPILAGHPLSSGPSSTPATCVRSATAPE